MRRRSLEQILEQRVLAHRIQHDALVAGEWNEREELGPRGAEREDERFRRHDGRHPMRPNVVA